MLDETLVYRVDSISVVEPTDISLLTIEENRDYVTLITCTPYAVNTHRLLVRGTRTEYTPEEAAQAAQAAKAAGRSTVEIVQMAAIAAGAVLFVVMVVLLCKPKRKRGKHEK